MLIHLHEIVDKLHGLPQVFAGIHRLAGYVGKPYALNGRPGLPLYGQAHDQQQGQEEDME